MKYLFSLFLLVPFLVSAADFTLVYEGHNNWAKSGDGTGFSAFLTFAKEEKPAVYRVILPGNEETSRDKSTARLRILAGILEKSLGHGVLIQEVDGTTAANTLLFKTSE